MGFTVFGGLYLTWLMLLMVLNQPTNFDLAILLVLVIFFPFAWIGGRIGRRFLPKSAENSE